MLATGVTVSQMQPSMVQRPSPQGDLSEVDFIKAASSLLPPLGSKTLCLK